MFYLCFVLKSSYVFKNPELLLSARNNRIIDTNFYYAYLFFGLLWESQFIFLTIFSGGAICKLPTKYSPLLYNICCACFRARSRTYIFRRVEPHIFTIYIVYYIVRYVSAALLWYGMARQWKKDEGNPRAGPNVLRY